MTTAYPDFPYPRYPLRRRFLKSIARLAVHTICRFELSGEENIPQNEPILVVVNHFAYVDPVATMAALPWYHEYLAGTARPAAPNKLIASTPDAWGVYKVKRATSSRHAFNAAEAVLAQDGMMVVFPEGGAWTNVLVPPRPGAALIAATNKCRLLPIGVMAEGLFDLFKTGRRKKVTVNVGKPFGPFEVTGRGRERRAQLDAIGEEMMRKIAELLPTETHGVYSDDPQLRAEAEKVAPFPWTHLEG